MLLNSYGRIVQREWLKSETLRAEIMLDEYVIMPNHFHGLVWIQQQNTPINTHQKLSADSALIFHGKSLASLVAGFKGMVTREIRRNTDNSMMKVWQRNYYEHIVRNEEGLNYLRYYIRHNPEKWDEDSLYSD